MDNVLKIAGTKKSFGKSLLYTLPMFLITFMFMTGGKPDFSDLSSALSILVAFLLVNVLYFLMHFTGKTDIIFHIDKKYDCSEKLDVVLPGRHTGM
jgi:hypothetical protein